MFSWWNRRISRVARHRNAEELRNMPGADSEMSHGRSVTIVNTVGDNVQKAWYVKNLSPKRRIRGGLSSTPWTCWKLEFQIYCFGIRDQNNPSKFLFACADDDKVILSESSFPPSENNGADNRLFRRVFSHATQTIKLQHVVSGKYVALDRKFRLVLKNNEEDGDEIQY